MLAKYLLLSVGSATLTASPEPAVTSLEGWLDLFLLFSALGVLLLSMFQLMVYSRGGPRSNPVRAIVLVVCLFVLHVWDFNLDTAWRTHREQIIEIVIALALCFVLIRLADWMIKPMTQRLNSAIWDWASEHFELPSSDILMPLSLERQKRSAVHEAGHVLASALLPTLDKFAISAQIESEISFLDDEVELGQVRHTYLQLGTTSGALLWQMLSLLSGQSAEQDCLGDFSSGGGDDISKWYSLAIQYLTSGFEGVTYFPEPRSRWHRETNALALQQLMERHRRFLGIFFALNHDLLVELSECLLRKKQMDTEELMPFVERAVLPKASPGKG